MSLATGTRLGPYEIRGAVGVGGMGEVYRAWDTRLDRTVALKVLADAFATEPAARTRFEREARAIAALDHPHICSLYDVGEVDGSHFLVMPLLEGETLAARLEKGAVPLDQAVTIGMQVADALDKAHRQGIVHRDLKPGNIMLTKAGAKLLDFGLAKLRSPQGPISMSGLSRLATTTPGTADGVIIGTVPYMAPEQVEGKDADARSDIWALGAVIYEMLTGTRAFAGDSPASIIGSILKDVVPPVSTRQPVVPAALDHVVGRCLEKDADERWQNAGDVKHALQWSLSTRPGPASQPARAHRAHGGRVVAALAGVAAIAMAVWASQQRPETIPEPPRRTFEIAAPGNVRITGASALSPDARWFAFVGQSQNGPPALWVRSLETGAARPLADTDDPQYPFWSPDSTSLGFFAGGRLKTIAFAGGAPRALAPAPNGRGGSWRPDGTILYVPEPNSVVFRVALNGGEPSAITSLDRDGLHIGHRWPTHVDADHFLFTVQSARPETTGIYIQTISSGRVTRLAGNFSNTAYRDNLLLHLAGEALVARRLDLSTLTLGDPVEVAGPVAYTGGLGLAVFSVAGDLLAFPQGTGALATTSMQWFDVTGKALRPLTRSSDLAHMNAYYPAISPDGRRVIMSAFLTATADLWLIDLDRDVASRFTSDASAELSPLWSPDGTEIVYTANQSGFYNLYRRVVGSSGSATRLTTASFSQYPTDWSRDGRTIVFTQVDADGRTDIYSMPLSGPPTALVSGNFNQYAGRLSPDGAWLAYVSDESGRTEVYVQRFPSGSDKAPISNQGGTEPQWRSDGKAVYFLAADRRINEVPLTLSPNLRPEVPRRLFDLPVDTSIGSMHALHFAVTRDNRQFVFAVSAIDQRSTTVVVNWRRDLTFAQLSPRR